MSKFCGNCGAELDDNAAVCGYCGMSFEKKSFLKNIPGLSTQSDEVMAQNIKKYGTFAAVGVAAIVVIAVVISLIVNNTGYRGVLKDYYKGYQKLDAQAVVELLAEADMYSYDDDEREEMVLESIENLMEEYEEDYGKDVKFKIEIVETTTWDLDDIKLRRFVERFEENEDYDGSSIEKAVEIEYDLTIKGDKKDHTDKNESIWLIKEDGKWKITRYDL